MKRLSQWTFHHCGLYRRPLTPADTSLLSVSVQRTRLKQTIILLRKPWQNIALHLKVINCDMMPLWQTFKSDLVHLHRWSALPWRDQLPSSSASPSPWKTFWSARLTKATSSENWQASVVKRKKATSPVNRVSPDQTSLPRYRQVKLMGTRNGDTSSEVNSAPVQTRCARGEETGERSH